MILKGERKVGDVVNGLLPYSKASHSLRYCIYGSIVGKAGSKASKKRPYWKYIVLGVGAGFLFFEYETHICYTPIIHRKQCIVFV